MDPGNGNTLTEIKDQNGTKEKEPVKVYSELAETQAPELSEAEMQALALAYARYLAEKGLKPGDATFTEPEELLQDAEKPAEELAAEPDEAPEEELTEEPAEEIAVEPAEEQQPEPVEEPAEEKAPEAPAKKPARTRRRRSMKYELPPEKKKKIERRLENSGKRYNALAAPLDLHDRLQSTTDSVASGIGRDVYRALVNITSTYRNSRRIIGTALLAVGILASLILVVFDRFTVYEYEYNGKTLGYVKEQEDVIDVLDIAGTVLTRNTAGNSEIVFTPGQNVTFRQIDGRGKSVDDADTVVNKLVYMTDIETEAYGIFDDKKLVAIVKSSEDADGLLNSARIALSQPDKGMEVVSSDFINPLNVKPLNVLLTSVQSYQRALELMVGGGETNVYHIVEEGETLSSIARDFAVEKENIFDESNTTTATEIERGDKVCIHEIISPLSVKMVEKGKMREILEFETIKKETDEYYKGDVVTKQEGVNGIQIFEGTITKVGGEVTDRQTDSIEKVRKKKNKILLIGTAERPKTAPTGTFAIPLDYYTITSNFGYRWGRLHAGVDLGDPTGTPIYASDGGTVIRSGWYGGYGQCIDIDHGNGRMTRYGHCSALLVSAGEQVYQGQYIGRVGNTGNSFGSHLHFEIHLNGRAVDPRPILGI